MIFRQECLGLTGRPAATPSETEPPEPTGDNETEGDRYGDLGSTAFELMGEDLALAATQVAVTRGPVPRPGP